MTLSSMTGFARSDGTFGGIRWHWELRTVNGKSLDIRCRLPAGFEHLESDVRKLAAKYISRGNCQISLSLKQEAASGDLTINEAALSRVVEVARRLAAEEGIAAPTADGLLALKGILDLTIPEEDDQLVETRSGEILICLDKALKDLVNMRRAEGAQLAGVLSSQFAEIEKLMGSIRTEVGDITELLKNRVQVQVDQLLSAQQSLDEDRLYQEVTLLAAKADVTEELDRLDAHIIAAKTHLTSSNPVGRKLEFLLQEFNREANTLCSKSATKEISALGLDMKALIDQIREQVMNIE